MPKRPTPNVLPVITIDGSGLAVVGQPYVITIVATDADGVIKRWSINPGDGQGVISGRDNPTGPHDDITYTRVGNFNIVVRATDNRKAEGVAVSPVQVVILPTPPVTDTTPDPYTIQPQSGAPRATLVTSVSFTPVGYTDPSPISVSGGAYSINAGAFVTTPGTLSPGQSVRMQLTTANLFSFTSEAQINIGGVIRSFLVTTEAQTLDTIPAAFGWTGVTGAALGTVVESPNEVTIQDINTTVPVSISGASGQYSKNGASYTSAAGTAVAGDRFRLRQTASGSNDTLTTTTLTVGGGSGSFQVRTVAAPVADATPDPFSWQTLTGLQLATLVESSDVVTVAGINVGVAITVVGMEYKIDAGAYTSAPGTVSIGQQVRVRMTTSASGGVTVTGSCTMGGVTGLFSTTTAIVTVGGATKFISTTGSNGNPGTEGSPWATAQFALSQINPGDRVLARGGTYDQSINSNNGFLRPGVSWAATVKLENYPGESPLFAPTNAPWLVYLGGNHTFMEFVGLRFDGTVGVQNSIVMIEGFQTPYPHHIRFQANDFNGPRNGQTNQGTNAPSAVLLAKSIAGNDVAGYCEFNQNTCHDGGDSGDDSYFCYIQSNGNTLDGNEIFRMRRIGVQIFGNFTPAFNTLRNNYVHDLLQGSPGAGTIGLLDYGNDNLLFNNIVASIATAGGGHGLEVAGARGQYYNNAFYNLTVAAALLSGGSALTYINNIHFQCGANTPTFPANATRSNNLFGTNPLWVAPDTGNFHLTANSPARNTGLTVQVVNVDRDGRVRPQESAYCIGPYEF